MSDRHAPEMRTLWQKNAATSREPAAIEPAVCEDSDRNPNRLAVCTDQGPGRTEDNAGPVRVSVVNWLGETAGSAEAPRGKNVEWDTSKWPDGPYEIRCSAKLTSVQRPFVHLAWYKGNWTKLAGELMDRSERAAPASDEPDNLRLRLLREVILDRIGCDPISAAPDRGRLKAWRDVHSALMEYRGMEEPEDRRAKPHALVRLAWRDQIDGSPQFAKAYLPPDYDNRPGARVWPMIVNLHGSNFSFPGHIHWGGVMCRHHPLAETHGLIVLEPHGRGMTSFEGIGELDVLKAVKSALNQFRVDGDRVYLMGCSMGGHGTYNVGSRHPDLFAALVSICGGGGFFHVYMSEQAIAELAPRERFRAELRSAWVQAESLLTTPIFICHGDADRAVSVEYSRYAAGLLRGWGYPVRYRELPGRGHGSMGCENDMARWLAEHRLNRNPQQVRVRAGVLKSASAHWVTVTQRKDPFDFIHVYARLTDPETIAIDSENALQISLSPGPPLISRARPVRLIWNGADTGQHEWKSNGLVLTANEYRPGKQPKTPLIEGPINDVMTTPFAIVAGTSSRDERMARFCRRQAEFARKAWLAWQRVEPRFFLDTEISDEQAAAYSLQLFGGPDENLVTRRLADRLPLSLATDKVQVAGQPFRVRDAAVAVVCPNPLNPERYVVVTAGNSADGMFFSDELCGEYDFTIADARGTVVAGRFDCNWQYDEAYVERTDPAKLAAGAARTAPRLSNAVTGERTLYLGDLLETDASAPFARNMNRQRQPIRPGGQHCERGLSLGVWDTPHTADFDIRNGGWRRFKATLGIEPRGDPASWNEAEKRSTGASFVVIGDGKEIYRSPALAWDSGPAEIEVDVSGVECLRLSTKSAGKWLSRTAAIDWGNARLEK